MGLYFQSCWGSTVTVFISSLYKVPCLNFRCPFKAQIGELITIKCPFEDVNCSVLTNTTQAVCSLWQKFLKQVLDEGNGDMNLHAN